MELRLPVREILSVIEVIRTHFFCLENKCRESEFKPLLSPLKTVCHSLIQGGGGGEGTAGVVVQLLQECDCTFV